MDSATLDGLIGAGGALLGTVIAWGGVRIAKRDSQRSQKNDDREQEDTHIRALARDELRVPMDSLSTRVNSLSHTAAPEMTRALVREELEPLKLDIREMSTKLQLYISGQAMGAAKVLHQPDPLRQPVDELLEAFMEGTLTPEERIRLKKILVTIRNYVPGVSPDPGFPIRDGEQYVASSLLATMDLVDPEIIGTMGHATHRPDGGKR